jgi:hypothetical protein
VLGPGAELLAVGMEGAVYRFGDGRVAKVWARRTTAELARLKAFYDELELPFATPRFEEIREVDGSAVSIERRVTRFGDQLRARCWNSASCRRLAIRRSMLRWRRASGTCTGRRLGRSRRRSTGLWSRGSAMRRDRGRLPTLCP